MRPNEAIESSISELLRGREFVKPLESQAGTASLETLGLELELAPFQFYRDEGIVLAVPGNPKAKGGCHANNGQNQVHYARTDKICANWRSY